MGNEYNAVAGDRLLKDVEQVADMPVALAEKTIDAIAHKRGDEFVKDILAHLPPVKIAAMLRQYDFSCPSIISWILTPTMIVNVLKIDPLFWKNIYDSNQSGNFYKIQNDALDLMTSILINGKSRDKQGAILKHISKDNLSLLYLFLPFIGWQIKKKQTLMIEDPDVELGTADHLYEMIQWAAPYVAQQIAEFTGSAPISLLNYITDLWLEAFEGFDTDPECKTLEMNMFLPVY
ncbi:MAG: hypothetical protein GY729_07500 [Desulfobacteraceae bacterium]|nr:hypothetical protein [Desulfobacteraceae bacterium]